MVIKNSKKRGFTLLELLVVIAIIGMFGSIVIGGISGTRQRADTSRLKSDFRQIQTQIDIGRSTANKTLAQLTSDTCTFCAFSDGGAIMSQASALASNEQMWQRVGFAHAPKDPWGRPYIADENEGDPGFPSCTVHDVVYSVGSNGLWESLNNTGDQTAPVNVMGDGLGDDKFYNITFYNCPGP